MTNLLDPSCLDDPSWVASKCSERASVTPNGLGEFGQPVTTAGNSAARNFWRSVVPRSKGDCDAK